MKKSLNYTILITTCPFDSGIGLTALEFCKALLRRQHTIKCVFFYFNASLFGNDLIIYPDDEINVKQQWQQFAQENNIACSLCVSSCLRRGIMDKSYTEQFNKPLNLALGFEIKGLTDLILAITESDRFIQFGRSH